MKTLLKNCIRKTLKHLKENNSAQVFILTFQENAIQISIEEANLSFKSSTVFLLLKSLFEIVTAVKRYQMEGEDEAAFQVMKDNCTFFICALLRNAKTILHNLNCKNGAVCLSGIDSKKVRKMIKQGCEVLQSIIVQHIGLFDCIQKAIPTVEVTKQKNRNAKVMNALSSKFNATSFTKRTQNN